MSDELAEQLRRIESERDLYREALGRIGRHSRCEESRDIADAALVKAKEMREGRALIMQQYIGRICDIDGTWCDKARCEVRCGRQP